MKTDRTEYLETKKDFFFKGVAPNEMPLLASLVTYQIDGEEVYPFVFDYENEKTGELVASYMVDKTNTRYTITRIGLRKRNELLRHVEKEKTEIKESLRKRPANRKVSKKDSSGQKEKAGKKKVPKKS